MRFQTFGLDRDRALEIPAGVDERVGLRDGSEGGADVSPSPETYIGEEACNRDESQDNDGCAHRERAENPGQPVER